MKKLYTKQISIIALSLSIFLNSLSGMLNDFVMAQYLVVKFNKTAEGFGLMIGVYFLGKLISLFMIGKLSDRFGRKSLLIIVFIFYLIGSIFAPLAPTYEVFILGRLIKGFAAYESVGLALINDYFKNDQKAKYVSFFNTAIMGGYVCGGIISIFFLIWFSNLTNFWILVGINGFALGIIIICIKPSKKDSFSKQNSFNFTTTISDTLKTTNFQENSSKNLKFYLRQTNYIIILTIALIFGVIFSGSTTYSTFLLLNDYQVFPKWLQVIFAQSINAIVTVTMYSIGKQGNTYQKMLKSGKILLYISPLNLLLLFFSQIYFLLPILLFQFYFMAIILPSLDNLVSNLTDEEIGGEIIGFYKTIYFLGSVMGSISYGYFGNWFGRPSPFLINVCFYLLMVFLFQKLDHLYQKKEIVNA